MLRPRFRCQPAFAAPALVCAALMATTPVRALTIRCVGNAGELRTALGEANAADADSPFLIQLRTGTYVNDGGAGASFEVLPHRAGQIVELSGGWEGANGSCQSRSYGPLRTVLKGTANRPALYFLLSSAGLQAGQLHLHDVDVTNPVFSEENNGACLRGVVQAGNAALIERVTARQCNAPYGAHASMKISNSGELTVRDVSVHSGTAKNNGGIGILTSEGGISRLAQISVTATQSSEDGFLGSGIALLNFGNAITHLSNSVTWGNDPDTDDLWLNGDGIVLTRVHYGRLSGTPAGNLVPGSGDPGFTAAGDARLRPDSALIDSGVSDPEGGSGLFDVDGNSRVRGAAVDVGAHEAAPPPDPIFHDGFDQGLD